MILATIARPFCTVFELQSFDDIACTLPPGLIRPILDPACRQWLQCGGILWPR
jgi:hypothetical protein